LFFKQLKQRLRANSLSGSFADTVKNQIRIALAAYFLVAIVRNRANLLDRSRMALNAWQSAFLRKNPFLLFNETIIEKTNVVIMSNCISVRNDRTCLKM